MDTKNKSKYTRIILSIPHNLYVSCYYVTEYSKQNRAETWPTRKYEPWNYRLTREQELERKNISPLNRVYPRPTVLFSRHLLRQDRAAARSRIGYRWRVHRRELKRATEGYARVTQPETQVPDNSSTGVDSLREEGGDISEMHEETSYTGSNTFQGDMEVDLNRN